MNYSRNKENKRDKFVEVKGDNMKRRIWRKHPKFSISISFILCLVFLFWLLIFVWVVTSSISLSGFKFLYFCLSIFSWCCYLMCFRYFFPSLCVLIIPKGGKKVQCDLSASKVLMWLFMWLNAYVLMWLSAYVLMCYTCLWD